MVDDGGVVFVQAERVFQEQGQHSCVRKSEVKSFDVFVAHIE